jgi:hypothetical protein
MKFRVVSVILATLLFTTSNVYAAHYLVNNGDYLVECQNGDVLLKKSNQVLGTDFPLMLEGDRIKNGERYVQFGANGQVVVLGDAPGANNIDVTKHGRLMRKTKRGGQIFIYCSNGACQWKDDNTQTGWAKTKIAPDGPLALGGGGHLGGGKPGIRQLIGGLNLNLKLGNPFARIPDGLISFVIICSGLYAMHRAILATTA